MLFCYTEMHGLQKSWLGPIPHLLGGGTGGQFVRRCASSRHSPADSGQARQGARKERRSVSIYALAARAFSDASRSHPGAACRGDGRGRRRADQGILRRSPRRIRYCAADGRGNDGMRAAATDVGGVHASLPADSPGTHTVKPQPRPTAARRGHRRAHGTSHTESVDHASCWRRSDRLFVHRRYVEVFGLPRGPEEISRHCLIGFDRDLDVMHTASGPRIHLTREQFRFRCDSVTGQLAALRAGVGIGACFVTVGQRNPDLIRVFERTFSFQREVWLAIHRDAKTTRRIRLLFDHLAERLSVSLLGTTGPNSVHGGDRASNIVGVG